MVQDAYSALCFIYLCGHVHANAEPLFEVRTSLSQIGRIAQTDPFFSLKISGSEIFRGWCFRPFQLRGDKQNVGSLAH
jgi:hypothetical protein